MAVVKPFRALRPTDGFVEQIAALPYDVYNRSEAKSVVEQNSLSFLQIDRGETLLEDSVSMYDDVVYETAAKRLQEMMDEDKFRYDQEATFYIYELERLGQIQRGIVGCVLAKEYEAGIIKKHENTREVKEKDRIKHIDVLKAHTGPIFLTYKNNSMLQETLESIIKESTVIFEFVGDDGIRHKGYKVESIKECERIEAMMKTTDSLYIADGHHRAASAVKIAQKYNYQGESGQFLAVMFPDNELNILDYNRVVTDLNGYDIDGYLEAIKASFDVERVSLKVSPKDKGTYGMYLDGQWYLLRFKLSDTISDDPVASLDVAILQDYLLNPILGIDDPRKSERIDFVGGIRGLDELERRVATDMKIAFSMKPTSILELIRVSDAGLLMPPKSTWFEPKLKSGLFIHTI